MTDQQPPERIKIHSSVLFPVDDDGEPFPAEYIYVTTEEHDGSGFDTEYARVHPSPAGDMEAIRERNDLICHMRVHSGYPNCGYQQMTSEQKTLYDAIWADEVATMGAEDAPTPAGDANTDSRLVEIRQNFTLVDKWNHDGPEMAEVYRRDVGYLLALLGGKESK